MNRITWDSVDQLTDVLAQQIRESNYEINLIIAVARGGFIPARLLSSRLTIKRMSSIGISYLTADRSERTMYSVPTPISQHDRILLVEDALETGRSLADAYKALEQNAGGVRTAAYYYRADSIIVPDFTVDMLSHIPRFPWE
jgi:uncharacterized protein